MRADRPSSTALLIAAASVFLSRDRRLCDLVPAGAAPWCAACLGAVSAGTLSSVEALSHPALRWAARLAERVTIPGLLLHFMVRKRWIEEAVRAGIARGCAQVVVLGAGFDTLALRLAPEFPQAQFFEIDHPATQRAKRSAVEAHGLHEANLRLVGADLASAGLEETLAGTPFRPERRSVFVVEGLLMYLAQAEIDALFGAISRLQPAQSRLVFTVMEPARDGHSRFHNATVLVRGLLSLWKEPFKSALPGSGLPAFLAPFGYRLKELARAGHLRAGYLGDERKTLPLAEGELLALAERG
jgi:methyltransferase (TIGR00027 family)